MRMWCLRVCAIHRSDETVYASPRYSCVFACMVKYDVIWCWVGNLLDWWAIPLQSVATAHGPLTDISNEQIIRPYSVHTAHTANCHPSERIEEEIEETDNRRHLLNGSVPEARVHRTHVRCALELLVSLWENAIFCCCWSYRKRSINRNCVGNSVVILYLYLFLCMRIAQFTDKKNTQFDCDRMKRK